MLGSLTMLAAGVLASSPSSVRWSGIFWSSVRLSGKLATTRQASLPIDYKGHVLSTPLRMDLIVESKVIVECKAVIEYHPIFEAQLLTYLRLSERRLGLVINFGERMLKDGVHRVANGL